MSSRRREEERERRLDPAGGVGDPPGKNLGPVACSHWSILYTYKFSGSSDEIYFFPRWRPAAILKLGRNRKIGLLQSLRMGL